MYHLSIFVSNIIYFFNFQIEKKNKEIKQIMNKTYHTLSERLASESHSELSFDYVKSTIANTIKVRKTKYTCRIALHVNILIKVLRIAYHLASVV